MEPSKWIALLTLLLGCGENLRYNKFELYQLGQHHDPELKIMLPESIKKGLDCQHYGAGCLGVFKIKHREVAMICVEYQKADQALAFGQTIDSYVVKNWLFDQVTGEPILEKFVHKAFAAQRARTLTPRP